MVPKRPFREEEVDGSLELPVQQSKRRITFQDAARDVMRGLSLHEIVSKLEPLFRSVVREEVEHAIQLVLHSSQRPSLTRIQPTGAIGWQLHFDNKLPSPLFTGSRIEAEDCMPLKVVLRDACTKNINSSAPFSSIKIEILVLDGDFGANGQEDWTEQEFNANIVREREGKRPLVTGDLNVILKDGVGYVGDLTFTDNSSWIRSRKFRLGARVVQSIPSESRIREARSEAFMVKDHRGELYKKHHPPSSGDEIWRLERIAKDGAFHTRLASKGINTVEDFLRLYNMDSSVLRNILGSGISTRTWDTIIEHASTCVLDDKFYYYRVAQRAGIVFNSIYKVVGAFFDGTYHSPDKFTFSQKLWVEDSKRNAYKNLNDLVLVDDPSVFVFSGPFWSLPADSYGSPSLGSQGIDFPIESSLGHPEVQLGFKNPSSSTSYEVDDGGQLEVSTAPNCYPVEMLAPTLGNSLTMRDSRSVPYSGESGWTPTGSLVQAMLTNHLAADDISQVQMATWFPVTATWGEGNCSLMASSSERDAGVVPSPLNFGVCISRFGKPKAGWCKIRAAVKWGISVRRIVAAKRMARFWGPNFQL